MSAHHAQPLYHPSRCATFKSRNKRSLSLDLRDPEGQAIVRTLAAQADVLISPATRIYFNEVVTRDGFQIEPDFISTDAKVALIDELSRCGIAKIEVTSFTSAKAIPMLRDSEAVKGRIRCVPGVEYTVLVPNVRGAERALESRADELNLVMSTSETHNLASLRMPREKSFTGLQDVITLAAGKVPINVSLSTCFGCPMEGAVPQAEVLRWADRFAALGVRGLRICDTTGMAHPAQVARMAQALRDRFASLQLTLHFHNTRGMGLTNVLAAASGVRAGLTLGVAVFA